MRIRSAFRMAMVTAGICTGIAVASAAAETPQKLALEIRETAGIRRFGYPVTAVVTLPTGAIHDVRRARLVRVDSGEPIPSQMTVSTQYPDGSIRDLEIDLILSPGPFESTELRLEFGDSVTAETAKQGLTFAETPDGYQVSAYRIRRDFSPLVEKVQYGREYLRGAGIVVQAREGGAEHRLSGARDVTWTVEKQGPLQVRLRCRGVYPGHSGLADLPFELVLEFASSKSWIGLTQVIPATSRRLVELETVAEFQLSGQLLWDLDPGYWLYGVLEQGDSLTFECSRPEWKCHLARNGRAAEYAASLPGAPRAHRWGHFQEARTDGNVVAFGMADCAEEDSLQITLESAGRMRVRSVPARSAESIRQSVFLHFIPVPLQHTAQTSPPSMMQPLQTKVLGGR